MKAAVAEAVKETDDQKKQEKEAGKELRTWKKKCTARSLDLLTPEQKDQIEAAKGKKATSRPSRQAG